VPSKTIPSAQAIFQAEESLSKEQSMPIRLLFLNPEEIKSSKLIWQIVVRPKERRTSEVEKLMFRAFMADAIPLGPDINFMRERLATTWGEDPSKVFPPQPPGIPGMAPLGQEGQQGPGVGAVSPRTNLPSPESALNRNIQTQLQTA
jgi:hypothetical protein